MMALRRPTLEGAGALAATHPPAQRTAVRADRMARGRRGGRAEIRNKRLIQLMKFNRIEHEFIFSLTSSGPRKKFRAFDCPPVMSQLTEFDSL